MSLELEFCYNCNIFFFFPQPNNSGGNSSYEQNSRFSSRPQFNKYKYQNVSHPYLVTKLYGLDLYALTKICKHIMLFYI